MKISKKKYPYEMYCSTCGKVEAYMQEMPVMGTPIMSEGSIRPDGTIPEAGDVINCNCGFGTARKWLARKRTETKMINQFMHDTTDLHSDMVDSLAYAIAGQYAKLKDDYFFIYVKKKPRYIPLWLYRWILSKVIVLAKFK